MMNPMKRFAGALMLMVAVVGCGPIEPAEEVVAPEQASPVEAPGIEAAGVAEFLACLNPPTQEARACVGVCVNLAPAASLVPCLVNCGVNLLTITACLPELAS
ncbi:hypothetical protein [Myxococcus qinghaiensis]|uniref:hypothetical protein n=1 Tax=Myxococcus qinghaiensis TaxID=2906758 RepID=UPI0020A72E3C|nr:hypothetical protein [Myxococcus qinghaiensis]MCP3162003.1 hypothetical protein [Myxococcus qinghaiensis]